MRGAEPETMKGLSTFSLMWYTQRLITSMLLEMMRQTCLISCSVR
jgi:hypothetical protein